MTPRPAKTLVLRYCIDSKDRLREMNAAWTEFAVANEGADVRPEKVVGRTLWEFIADAHVIHLYRQMVRRARTRHPVQFDYRCDAPEWRRLFRMTIRPARDDGVEFASRLRWEEPRPRVPLLDCTMPRNAQWTRVCSWCQKIHLPDGCWVPVETAVADLGLLAGDALPQLTHGICPACTADLLLKHTSLVD